MAQRLERRRLRRDDQRGAYPGGVRTRGPGGRDRRLEPDDQPGHRALEHLAHGLELPVPGGLCSILAKIFLANGVAPKRFLPIALDERWFRPALLDEVLEYEGYTGGQIAARVLREVF